MSKTSSLVAWFEALERDDVPLVGGASPGRRHDISINSISAILAIISHSRSGADAGI